MSKVKMKALLEKGLAELCSYMKKYTAALGDLASATADGLDEKQDITAAVSFTIPTTGWARDSTLTSYYYCDISIAGLRATDIVDVTPAPESYSVARTADPVGQSVGICALPEVPPPGIG